MSGAKNDSKCISLNLKFNFCITFNSWIALWLLTHPFLSYSSHHKYKSNENQSYVMNKHLIIICSPYVRRDLQYKLQLCYLVTFTLTGCLRNLKIQFSFHFCIEIGKTSIFRVFSTTQSGLNNWLILTYVQGNKRSVI